MLAMVMRAKSRRRPRILDLFVQPLLSARVRLAAIPAAVTLESGIV